jgi:hypothetical protein
MVDSISQIVSIYRMARALRVPAEWLADEARSGRLPHVNACGRLLFNPVAVEKALAERAMTEGLRESER